MTRRRVTGALFVLALGLGWVALWDPLSFSGEETAIVAAVFLLAAIVIVISGGGPEDASPGRLLKWWRRLSYRAKINLAAGIFAVAVGIATGALLLPEPNPDDGECPTPSKNSTCPSPGETTTKTTTTNESGTGENGPLDKEAETTVVEEKTSVAKPDESLLGRAVDNQAGVTLVRFGLALLAAFIAGLVAQRIGLGKYGVKLPFGLGEFEEISDEQAKAVTEKAKEDPALKTALETSAEERVDVDLPPGDTRVKLVVLRDDVENKLRAKAEAVDIDKSAPIDQVIDGLSEQQVIGPQGRSALRDMIELGDKAAQGAPIEPGVRAWLAEEGQHLPAAIDKLEPSSS